MDWFALLVNSVLLLSAVLAGIYIVIRTSRKSVIVQTTTSRYSRESRRIKGKLAGDNDGYDISTASKLLWNASPDRVLARRLYKQTIDGKLNWYAGQIPVFYLYIVNGSDRVDFEIRKYIDSNERNPAERSRIALTIEVSGMPAMRIECLYTHEENKTFNPALVDLYDHLVKNCPLNLSVSYSRSAHLNEKEAIILEKATDIIESV